MIPDEVTVNILLADKQPCTEPGCSTVIRRGERVYMVASRRSTVCTRFLCSPCADRLLEERAKAV